MIHLDRTSFGRVALRMGLITGAQLEDALRALRTRGCSIERALLEAEVLTPDLADHVRAATRVVRRSA